MREIFKEEKVYCQYPGYGEGIRIPGSAFSLLEIA
jgi:hypothetical protein